MGDSEDHGGIANLFTPEVQAWEEEILIWSDQYMLDPNLVATVMQIESCGYAQAVSPAGAKGLFQVMPYHFHDGEDPFFPETNAKRGLMYLRMSLEKGGSTLLTLAGYNGGITGAQRPQEEWPDEVHRYVYWGLQIYQDAGAGKEQSARLDEWLQRGGGHLCQQAREQ
jgi:soluble lytic murein transglycosylase-like protein